MWRRPTASWPTLDCGLPRRLRWEPAMPISVPGSGICIRALPMRGNGAPNCTPAGTPEGLCDAALFRLGTAEAWDRRGAHRTSHERPYGCRAGRLFARSRRSLRRRVLRSGPLACGGQPGARQLGCQYRPRRRSGVLPPGHGRMSIRIQAEDFDIGAEIEALKRDGNVGAVVTFTGVVRGDDNLRSLALEHYPGMTE